MKPFPLPQGCRRFGLLAALATGLCLAIPTASAAGDSLSKTPSSRNAKTKVVKPRKVKAERVVITGSHIPQEIKKGKKNVTAVPVDIITSDQIRRMGAVSLPFVLSRQTGFR